ncbi:hypothetical protein GCM10023085_61570 [Actinomadura viridis]|uniref:Uncharacterized protein n=1 Tax=Actinomadura viridis TaxID=58110 RepID=A0A931DJ80_9ACTN|nr:hypothetical protein [Actinomadura viridis]MBG6090397.1 hypothetical protein [Actinomadura viridis]
MPGRTDPIPDPVSDRISAHARVLGADAGTLAECAARLRRIADRLRSHDAAPPWLYAVLDGHITACVVASADLADASGRLEEYAAAARRHGSRRPAPPAGAC